MSSLDALVSALDGLPLALELAAGWTDLFSPRELLERNEDRFTYLRRTGQDVHHGTLAAVIARSWDALDAYTKRHYANVLFNDGFTAEMAEAIVVVEGASAPVAFLLRTLIDRSLLFVAHQEGQRRMYLHRKCSSVH